MYTQQQTRTTVLAPRLRRLYSIRLVKEPIASLEKAPHKVAIRGPQDVFAFMRPFAEQEAAESFWALPLDTQHHCVAPHTTTRGLLNCSLVHPREVFRAMIAANAASVILVHNHHPVTPHPPLTIER